MDLFTSQRETQKHSDAPLAYRMRPQSLDDIVGQQHLLGPGAPLRRMISGDRLHSFILYGPPGTGKTTTAQVIARSTQSRFITLSAVNSSSTEIKKVAKEAESHLAYYQRRTILFIDEIHRFNKAQQDVLLPILEDGTLLLIGATTENPLYEINSALLSRLRVYVLQPIGESDLRQLVLRALTDRERGLGLPAECLVEDGLATIIQAAKGDGRAALTLLEMVMSAYGTVAIGAKEVMAITGKMATYYDKKGDRHYDTISAFIKSIRGSDPDAALFYLAVMIDAGEDPIFIARRLVVHAAEDIGLADPNAMLIAQAAAAAVQLIGMPEGRIPLAEATIYLATAPKSNTAKVAIDQALQAVREAKKIEVPRHLRDTSHSQARQRLGHGVGYKYPHDFGGYTAQRYLPEEFAGAQFYTPSDNGREKQIQRWMAELKAYLGNEGSPKT
ncbi:replication-associated recombination protein A [Heliophilum fasciatum]|uniref:Putative ATPase n=1 Tax=Heliophilum fasciatum TaxID=35700 RepID=A0A4V2SWY8_9FIRM|nr:replication-associated recombination protein A [Heliophilum fasciatum]MCW2278116.1 putative ATPase [Heliophilum fasciatum]TCP64186.1 putative ATPase [Heliophilum fasciatum]